MGIAALSFLAPLALLGLLALPALWWLLRALPPQPATTPFAPLHLLAKLTNGEETPVTTPWWLLVLRLAMLALLILAFAGPVWRASAPITLPGDDALPLLIVVETDWASAQGWTEKQAQITRVIGTAERQGRPLALFAFPQAGLSAPLPAEGASARAALALLEPQPVPLERAEMRQALDILLASDSWAQASLVWFTNGLASDDAHAAWLADTSTNNVLVEVHGTPPALALTLDGGADGPAVTVSQLQTDADQIAPAQVPGTAPQMLTAYDGAGRPLGTATLTEQNGQALPRIAFDLPLDLRNDIARIAVTPSEHAGHVVLVDDRLERRRVGIVAGERRGQAQPLLAGSTYVERGLRPSADLTTPRSGDTSGDIAMMIETGVDVIVLVDVASLIPSTVALLEPWMDAGGVLIRFASTGLTQSADGLLPVPLRAVDRQLGGALTWEEPQAIAPFAPSSPFAGLTIPADIRIERQVLSEPGAAITTRTLAELEDSTPLVTGQARGNGQLILFHITADTSWSNLPLSGLFVEMLRRLVDLASTAPANGLASSLTSSVEGQALSPLATLNGVGQLGSPPASAEGLMVTAQSITPSLANPPGFYGPASSPYALNLFSTPPSLMSTQTSRQTNAQALTINADESLSLRPALLTGAVLLALADAIIVLILSGGLIAARRARATSILFAVLAASLAMPPQPLRAQESAEDVSRLIAAANTTRFAYVVTGQADVDQRSQEGLSGLSRLITQRTAFEPGAPLAVDPLRDELAFHPLIYWPLPSEPIEVSDVLVARIDAYMNNGGTILFDTRDEAATLVSSAISPQTANLRALLSALDIPALEPVPGDHVLTKSFYLLDSFPGRFASGPLWVEALPASTDASNRPARGGDGVSAIMITGNDFASAWALSRDGRPLYATSPPDPVQREFAYRTGINIAMYVMTGNYKADQVHIPALLERLVQ